MISQQVKKYNLVSNPTKKADSRRKKYVKKFGDKCWELDALPPPVLEKMVRKSIEKEIDTNKWKETERQEIKDRERLHKKISMIEKDLKRLI